MAFYSTPLNPLELPPFTLTNLRNPVFTSHNVGGRFSGISSTLASESSEKLSNAFIRSVVTGSESVWVGSSDGQVREYCIALEDLSGAGDGASTPGTGHSRVCSPSGSSSSRRSASTPTPKSGTAVLMDNITKLQVVEAFQINGSKKSVDKICILERLNMAALLSEGVLTMHSLPDFTPSSSHPPMRGVVTISLNESELDGGGDQDSMHLCVIKRKFLVILTITPSGYIQTKDLGLPNIIHTAIYRDNYVCIGDAQFYHVVDLVNAVAMPLVAVSQRLDDTEETQKIDPHHRPCITCVGSNEFLLASHNENTTIGVFVNELGDAQRGTLQWGGNVRSLVVDGPYVAALLFNNTIEIHSITTLEIVQLIQLKPLSPPSSPTPSESRSITYPPVLEPRSLVKSYRGLSLGANIVTGKSKLVTVGLFPAGDKIVEHLDDKSFSDDVTRSNTLLVGKNELLSLVPLTLTVQCEALWERGRFDDAILLADQMSNAMRGEASPTLLSELMYIYMRTAFHQLKRVLFQDSFDSFLKSKCDPRLIIRMFPDLQAPLSQESDQIKVPLGVQHEVSLFKSMDQYILSNLNRNYSPHIEPSVEAATSTMALRTSLSNTARDCLRTYLQKWRKLPREGLYQMDSRKVDLVVDTTLVRLYAEKEMKQEIYDLFAGSNTCLLQQVEPYLFEAGMYKLTADQYLRKEEIGKTLDIWTRIIDGEYQDSFENGLEKVFNLLESSNDKILLERYSDWLLKKDLELGVKLLSSRSSFFDKKEILRKIRAVDEQGGDLFLEQMVLQHKDSDIEAQTDLIMRHLLQLQSTLEAQGNRECVKQLDNAYQIQSCSLISFLASRISPSPEESRYVSIRLKVLVFITKLTKYDLETVKGILDIITRKAPKSLELERAIIYGRIQLDRQALSLLVNTISDIPAAQTYCRQLGDPLLQSEILEAAKATGMTLPKRWMKASKIPNDERRRADLGKMFIHMFLAKASEEPEKFEHQSVNVLASQSWNMGLSEVLSSLPDAWSVATISPILSNSLRRSLHRRDELTILRNLTENQNLNTIFALGQARARIPPVIQREPVQTTETTYRPELNQSNNPIPVEIILVKGEKEGDDGPTIDIM